MAYIGIISKQHLLNSVEKRKEENLTEIFNRISKEIITAANEGYKGVEIDWIGDLYQREVMAKLAELKYSVKPVINGFFIRWDI